MLNEIPSEVVDLRVDICSRCEGKCDKMRADPNFNLSPCNSCPEGKWSRWSACRGLGDAVAAIAQPVAKVIDLVAGTNVQGCGACKKRQEALNALIPNL